MAEKIAQAPINNQSNKFVRELYNDKAISGVSNIYFSFLTNSDIFKMFKYFFSFSSIEIA
jgi:hypothetical protein